MSLQHRKAMARAFDNSYGYSSGAAFVLADIARECQQAIVAKVELLFTAPIGARRDAAIAEIDSEIKHFFLAAEIIGDWEGKPGEAKNAAFYRFIETVELCAINWALRCYKGRRLP